MKTTEKIWNRRFILLFLTNLLVLAAFYASIPIIPVYCQEIGITGSLLMGFLQGPIGLPAGFALTAIAYIIGFIVYTAYVDRYYRKLKNALPNG